MLAGAFTTIISLALSLTVGTKICHVAMLLLLNELPTSNSRYVSTNKQRAARSLTRANLETPSRAAYSSTNSSSVRAPCCVSCLACVLAVCVYLLPILRYAYSSEKTRSCDIMHGTRINSVHAFKIFGVQPFMYILRSI